MVETKKVLFIGPPGTGKTTIKNVFFEMVSPLKLLKNTLDPTRGINSSIYSFFELDLGVFDLAGQENEDWFSKDSNIFNHTNLIICVLDINRYLGENIDFIGDVIKIQDDLKLGNCSIAILLHKIDLIEPLYLQQKLKAINDYLKNEKRQDLSTQIFPTSITKKYFIETYDIVSQLFCNLIKDKIESINEEIFKDFRLDLQIILQYSDLKEHLITDLFYDLDLSSKDTTLRLKRLEKLGFLEFSKNSRYFNLTERASFFKLGLKSEEIDEKETKINKILESLYIFSNLIQKNGV
jgi:GTPase SAR1 family protein